MSARRIYRGLSKRIETNMGIHKMTNLKRWHVGAKIHDCYDVTILEDDPATREKWILRCSAFNPDTAWYLVWVGPLELQGNSALPSDGSKLLLLDAHAYKRLQWYREFVVLGLYRGAYLPFTFSQSIDPKLRFEEEKRRGWSDPNLVVVSIKAGKNMIQYETRPIEKVLRVIQAKSMTPDDVKGMSRSIAQVQFRRAQQEIAGRLGVPVEEVRL